jgi:hypothetical protein
LEADVATAQRTRDHDEIRQWVERNNGRPAVVKGTGVLRIDFGQPEESLDAVGWDRFFQIFDRSNVDFLYDPRGHMVKFVEERHVASGNGRRKKSSTRGRKKTTRKKTSSRRKSASRKKSAPRKKTPSRKKTGGRKKSSSRKKSGRKYGPKAGRKVERSMTEMKEGKLRSGRSGKKVTSRKQAIAIGLSEARRSGGKVPPNPNRRKRSR